jgi:hypothetical protein
MSASPPDVLRRMAVTLRTSVGPAVEEPFAKTQAFMAAVVLTKLAGQLAAAEADAGAADAERAALIADLDGRLPAAPQGALDALRADGSDRAWGALVVALYGAREELGGSFDGVLRSVRAALRARLDRALVYSS